MKWTHNPEPVGPYGNHPVFDLFPAYRCSARAGGVVGWDGSVFTADAFLGIRAVEQLKFRIQQVQLDHLLDPSVFEWIDLLESARASSDNFRFVELGAGYGRWSVRAWRAALAAGVHPSRISILTVEPVPQHNEWLNANMVINEIPERSRIHFDCAVAAHPGRGEFFLRQPGALDKREEAQVWYGQSLVRDNNQWHGAYTQEVQIRTLTDILRHSYGDDDIDLVDMDLQGEELAVVSEAKCALRSVKKLHIATHSTMDDEKLQRELANDGWQLVRRYGPNSTTPTNYGVIRFVDGLMTFQNRRFLSRGRVCRLSS